MQLVLSISEIVEIVPVDSAINGLPFQLALSHGAVSMLLSLIKSAEQRRFPSDESFYYGLYLLTFEYYTHYKHIQHSREILQL